MELIIMLIFVAILIQYVDIPQPTLKVLQFGIAFFIAVLMFRVFFYTSPGEPVFWFRR